MTTELRNDPGEPRVLNDTEIDSVAGGGNELLGAFLGGPLVGTAIGKAVGSWADDGGTDSATPATPHRLW